MLNTKKINNLLQLTLLLIGSLILSGVVIELTLRIFNLDYANIPLDRDSVYHHVHPKNHSFTSFSGHGDYGGFTVHFDSNGFITNPDKSQSASTGPLIAFMGDSYTEGYQVPYQDTFVAHIQEAFPAYDVKNYGVAAYSGALNYLQWKYIVKKQKPKIVFLLVYWQYIARDTEYIQKAYYDHRGELLGVDGGKKNLIVQIARSSFLVRFMRRIYLQAKFSMSEDSKESHERLVGIYTQPDSPNFIDSVTSNYIKKIADEAKGLGDKFVLLAVPSVYDDHHGIEDYQHTFSKKVEDWSRVNSIQFMDLTRAFHEERIKTGKSNFYEWDIHFNEQGNAVVARIITDFLKKNLPTAAYD